MNRKNSRISSQPPPGLRDFLPVEAEFINRAANTLLDEFSRWGYRRVITPGIDYLDVFLLSSIAKELFKIADINSGELLSLRSDFTPQIGRLSSSLRNSTTLPYKFSYFGPVLRNSDPNLGKPREILQVGVELIGPNSPESDAELIIMGIEALKKLNIMDFSVDIGNVDFFRGIVSDIPEAERKKIEEYTLKKDSSGLAAFLNTLDLSRKKKEIINGLLFMFGKKTVIKKAWKMAHNEMAINALETMERVLSYIKLYGLDDYITIDFGEIRGLNYYTGTIFECFAPNTGYEIFGGGRYNNLIGAFGENCPGAGFAVNMDILRSFSRGLKPERSRVMVFNGTKDKELEVEIIKFLRSRMIKAESNFMNYGYKDALKYTKENDIEKIVFIDKTKIILEDVSGLEKKNFKNLSEFKKHFKMKKDH